MNRSCLHALRLLPIGIVVLLAACDRPASDADPASEEPESTAPAAATPTADSRPAAEVREDPELRATKKKVVKTYADLVHANYSDALRTAKILRQAIGELIENPSEASLRSAQEAWRAARVPYLQTEVYRFYGGPIDNDEDGVEALLNAWPLDEGYIDYVRGNPDSGIIQNEEDYPEISQTLLVELNEKESVTNVSTGYHAIEFLLWGQDFSENGPGDRAYTDYVKAADGPGATAERRGDYLRAITDLLAEDLQSLVEAWSPDAQGNYREKFLAAPADDSVQKILQGMGMLAGYELSGERLSVPYETGSQEDEHSCFSDHTHVGTIENTRGIANLWMGQYETLDGTTVGGPGIQDLARQVDPELADRVTADLVAALQVAGEIPAPFDQAIRGPDSAPGRTTIRKMIDLLLDVTAELRSLGDKLGTPIPIEGREGPPADAAMSRLWQ